MKLNNKLQGSVGYTTYDTLSRYRENVNSETGICDHCAVQLLHNL